MKAARAYGPSWFDQLHAQGVARVAQSFGYELAKRGRSLSMPCPACGQATRHRKAGDKRGAVEIVHEGSGFVCWQCEATGDAPALAALVVTGKAKPDPEGWATVRRACAERGLVDPDPRDNRPPPKVRKLEPPPPPSPAPPAATAEELETLMAAGVAPWLAPVSESEHDQEAALYMSRRGLSLGDLALFEPELVRILPGPEHAFPSWWPHAKAHAQTEEGELAHGPWRLALRMYSARGELVSIQARAVVAVAKDKDKTRNAVGCSVGLFADSRGLAFLRGERDGIEEAIVCEGLTDTVAAAVKAHLRGRRRAVLGVVEGATRRLGDVSWPRGFLVFVSTDADEKGEKFAREVRAALPAWVRMKRKRFNQEGAGT